MLAPLFLYKTSMTNFWDERFSEPGYAYGKEPNEFLRSVSSKLPKGKTLSLAEGEGRNAVFLSSLGHSVTAVDQSSVGLKKAIALAEERGVSLQTIQSDLSDFIIEANQWDSAVLFFGHFSPELRRSIHEQVVCGLKKGGSFVMECFSKGQLGRGTGGPQELAKLYDENDLREDLRGMEFEICRTVVRQIHQGKHHGGEAEVIQILAWRR